MDNWQEIIQFLKSDECKSIAKFYSSVDGWANIAYKSYRVRIDNTWNAGTVIMVIRMMLDGSPQHIVEQIINLNSGVHISRR